MVHLLTVKNVVEVSEISLTFNAPQLYSSCVEFATQNLPWLMHTGNFLYAEEQFLSDMEDCYR